MGLHARAEQGEPLSGSANTRLCLAGRLSQSFNRAQVIHKTCVTGTLVFLILQAQERRRVNGDQDPQSVCEIEDGAAIALDRDRSSRQTLRRGYSEGDDNITGKSPQSVGELSRDALATRHTIRPRIV